MCCNGQQHSNTERNPLLCVTTWNRNDLCQLYGFKYLLVVTRAPSAWFACLQKGQDISKHHTEDKTLGPEIRETFTVVRKDKHCEHHRQQHDLELYNHFELVGPHKHW